MVLFSTRMMPKRRRAMGTQTKISQLLKDQGYKNVLATDESHAGGVSPVKYGQPFTWDYNNGVIVVYDESGEPWIRENRFTVWEQGTFRRELEPQLRRGAYVPHSNDGGHFVREVLPTL